MKCRQNLQPRFLKCREALVNPMDWVGCAVRTENNKQAIDAGCIWRTLQTPDSEERLKGSYCLQIVFISWYEAEKYKLQLHPTHLAFCYSFVGLSILVDRRAFIFFSPPLKA